mgnify:CR=1 FL=1
MLIKIVQNGIESDWFPLTKKTHRELMQKKPEAAIVHIEDVYPDSPDTGRIIQLDFRLFTVLTREFVLEELRQKKQIADNTEVLLTADNLQQYVKKIEVDREKITCTEFSF